MKELFGLALAMVVAMTVQGADPDPDTPLIRAIGRSASRLLEVATHISAKEKTTVRHKLRNGAWYVQDVNCNLHYIRRDDGIHERRSGCSMKVNRNHVDDLSQAILLFAPAMINRYKFQRVPADDIAGRPVVAFQYEQREGVEAVTLKEGRRVEHRPVRGTVWVAADGSGVLRMTIDNERPGNFRDHVEVNYIAEPDGSVIPVSALWQQFENDEIVSEMSSKYTRTGGAGR